MFSQFATFFVLGWSQETEELTEVSVVPTEKDICEEISEVSPNTICTEEKVRKKDSFIRNSLNLHFYLVLFQIAPGIPCTGEQFAGAPLMCQRNSKWFLVGILAWRKGCSTVGQRPRLYDRIAITNDWAQKVMLKLNEASRVPRKYKQKIINLNLPVCNITHSML